MAGTIILWFTGLSGSGKTTIANGLKDILTKEGETVITLDGDDMRNTIHAHLGFTPEDIKRNNELAAKLCRSYCDRYDYILVPIISPFKESRGKARSILGRNFIEIYIKASLANVIKRDVKGLYAKALNGEIDNFIGLSQNVPYEAPDCPDIIIDTDELDISSSVEKIYNFVKTRKVTLHKGDAVSQ